MHIPVRDILARLVMAAGLLIAATAGGLAQELSFRTYKDVAGFSCEFPSDWRFDQARNFDRVFTGPPETAWDATIIIQVIEQDKAAEKTASGQLEALKAQLLRAQDGAFSTRVRPRSPPSRRRSSSPATPPSIQRISSAPSGTSRWW